MNFINEHIIDSIYNTGLIGDIGASEEYNKLRKQYSKLYDSIPDEELKNKFSKLEEIKTDMYSQYDKDLFRIGFSMAIKLVIECATLEI